MKKVFKLLAYIFVSSVIVFGVVIIIYRQNIFEYLNSINNLGVSTRAVLDDIKNGNNLAVDLLNLSIVNNPKFKKMQLTTVDLTGLNISTSTELGEGNTPGPETGPTFDVGNSNPFKAF